MKMVYFACKKVDLEELYRCSFGISRTEYRILMTLLKNSEPKSVEQLAIDFRKDRTTIQKAIQHLVKKKLVSRRQFNLQNGGYTYYYFVKDKDKIKKDLQNIIKNWYVSVLEAVKNT